MGGVKEKQKDEGNAARGTDQFFLALIIGSTNLFIIVGGFLAIPLAAIKAAICYPLIVTPLLLLYIAYTMLDPAEKRDGRPFPWFTENFPLLNAGRRYFNLKLHVPETVHAGGDQFIIGLHPHGVASDARLLLDGLVRQSLPNIKSWRALAASVLFKFPMVRELCLWTHCIDASRATAERALKKGHSLFITVGGEREQLLCEYGKEVLYLKNRTGFIRLAIKHNIKVVPTYIFGTNDLYSTSNWMHDARYWLVRKLQVAIPLFWGRGGLPAPYHIPLNLVFGDPLDFSDNISGCNSSSSAISDGGSQAEEKKKAEEELQKRVITGHARYIAAVTELFDQNKVIYGYGDRKLVIV